ncbi:hypothetical protein P872_07865 [Rhodonellum psychrophilum GCM71 = DSM 17998]|uniref:Uncharacterized protein n=1 Tax=Rhodonellum psychrophilum GCM71 = DSM 17998 TaxID=1123057 RepID=U5BZ25_9BACT|nr:hypothetical protein P872_07865 [Rhodonellum psychrophilum GCM71 = DSM 17998]
MRHNFLCFDKKPFYQTWNIGKNRLAQRFLAIPKSQHSLQIIFGQEKQVF